MSSQIDSVPFANRFQFQLTPSLQNDYFRLWKRRRLKRATPYRGIVQLRSDFRAPSALPSEFLSVLSSNWIPTAVLGFASGLAVSLSSNRFKKENRTGLDNSVGEWILFSSPTPFNRFVLLRCPSIEFEGGEFLENVGEKLVRDERHYVRVDSGRIVDSVEEEEAEETEVEYQRVCVEAEDGGVISIDWPVNLELSDERGMDTTVLIVPGTTEGSMEGSVKEFVKECLKRGLFPVVVNPRGCANSPLTTARLFTAADSDDICSAIQFITRARPWSTLTGVGWGYGANMLTKYLAEAGEKTPLTAATCINNPFDLDEATRTSMYNTSMDKKVTRGLINILKSNKELFQGKRKGFDVEKALAAESIRDFDTAISMVSYGFESVEDFYANCSTRSMIENLKIPVLFIQNDDGIVPMFSMPREFISENPFTSLLLYSSVTSDAAASSWYQRVTIEWLAAVELGLLKGRHPLLQDIDVTINPSKNLALLEERSSNTDSRLQRLLNQKTLNRTDPIVDPVKKMLTESAPAAATSGDLQYNPTSIRNNGSDDVMIEPNNISPNGHPVDTESTGDSETIPAESDTSEMLQTTQVVMNMLDVTMPGTLKEEEKQKVIKAVSQGETLINALQDAVPEEVRGKLTASVSEILQEQGKNLNLDGLLSIKQIANISSGFKSETKEKESEQSNTNAESNDHLLNDKDIENDTRKKNSSNQGDAVDVSGKESPASQSQEKPLSDIRVPSSAGSHSDDSGREKGSIDSQNIDAKHDGEVSEKMEGQLSEGSDDGSKASNSLDAGVMDKNISQDDNIKEPDSKEQDTSSATDIKPGDGNEAPPSPIAEGQLTEKGEDDSVSTNEKIVQPQPDQNRVSDAKSPSFNVTQALEALTGLDDSTQVAVNSVFGVIEDMIAQLEEKKKEKDQKGTENHDSVNGSVLGKNSVISDLQLEKPTVGKDEEDANSAEIDLVNNVEQPGEENNMQMNLTAAIKGDENTNISKIPSNLTTDPFTKALYKEYLQNYIISKFHNGRSSNLDPTAGLYLRYVPEEGHWILLENPSGNDDLMYKSKDKLLADENDIIEPSYVVLDKDGRRNTTEEPDSEELLNYDVLSSDNTSDNSISSVKTILLDSLRLELSRRLSVTDMKEMEDHLVADMEKVAEAVNLAIEHDNEQSQSATISRVDNDYMENIMPNQDHLVEAISEAVQDTGYLKKVLPVGVIVGSSLAALRNCCDGTSVVNSNTSSTLNLKKDDSNSSVAEDQLQQKDDIKVLVKEKNEPVVDIIDDNSRNEEERVTLNSLNGVNGNEAQSKLMSRDNLMVGAVTAALGASAFLSTQQEDFMEDGSYENLNSEEMRETEESSRLEEAGDSKQHSNIITSLAEKAMSVAAPVVPTKETGEVDHERLVATLTELGQRGGMLRLVSKLALLWGGLRGAISLTDRLLSFLRVAERPLVQRILGFCCMVLVLWSPVLIPLLPTLFHNMATHNSSKIAELACIVGLYAAVTILTMQWGKRIRGYKYPLKQYGLDLLSSRKVLDFLAGLAGGVVLVLSIHSVNAFLGFVSFSLPTNLTSPSLDLTTKLKAYGRLFLLAGQGILMAAAVTFVEELLFRSWLLEEVAADLGYPPAIILSGLAFALTQRSVFAIPGLWLWSVCLAGARLRKEGCLSIPIGLRTGVMSSSFMLQMGGFLICQPRSEIWVAGMHPLQPFTGVVGILVALLLAVVLYPRQPGLHGRVHRPIRPLKLK